MYEKLDGLIVAVVKDPPLRDKPLRSAFFATGDIGREVERISTGTGRDKFRVLDGRLQALRRKGMVRYSPERGWIVGVNARQ